MYLIWIQESLHLRSETQTLIKVLQNGWGMDSVHILAPYTFLASCTVQTWSSRNMMITPNVLISQRIHSSLRGLVLYRPHYMWTKFLSGQLLIMHANFKHFKWTQCTACWQHSHNAISHWNFQKYSVKIISIWNNKIMHRGLLINIGAYPFDVLSRA